MVRMRILTATEQEAFNKPPQFNHRERKQFFDLPKGLLDLVATLRSPSGQIGFLVMCAYFKATKRFYQPHDFFGRDISYAAHQLDLDACTFQLSDYAETTRLRHQKHILKFYGFTAYDDEAESALTVEISTMARTHLRPCLIFGRSVDFLVQQHIEVPSARILTDLIRKGLQERKSEMVARMDMHLSAGARCLLDGLFTAPDDQNRYRLTLLKKLSQSVQPAKNEPLERHWSERQWRVTRLLITKRYQSCTVNLMGSLQNLI